MRAIYLVQVRDTNLVDYDEFGGFVVVADSKPRAREMAAEESSSRGMTSQPFTDQAYASCILLGRPVAGQAKEQIVLSDFRAG